MFWYNKTDNFTTKKPLRTAINGKFQSFKKSENLIKSKKNFTNIKNLKFIAMVNPTNKHTKTNFETIPCGPKFSIRIMVIGTYVKYFYYFKVGTNCV